MILSTPKNKIFLIKGDIYTGNKIVLIMVIMTKSTGNKIVLVRGDND